MIVHVTRQISRSGRPTIMVVAPYSNGFVMALTRWIPQDAQHWFASLGAWEIDAEYEGPLERCIEEGFGAGKLCAKCVTEECDDVDRILAEKAATAARLSENILRGISRWEAQRQRWQRPSRSKELGEYLGRPMEEIRASARASHAARILGLTLPTTRAHIAVAFRIAALASHPDRGGTDAGMREVIGAREELMKEAA
jgi:hypothetical protein